MKKQKFIIGVDVSRNTLDIHCAQTNGHIRIQNGTAGFISIKGIGKVNGWMTIAYTENFTSFLNGRSYAVYVGVIPFDHSSGISIKGKKRVSNLANKELKSELSQAAKSAMQHDKEIREYAERKLKEKDWGKVINNVKFKLILRMFAVVKRGSKYVDNYQVAA